MVDKVNGGVKQGFWTEGAVQFYTISVLPADSFLYLIAQDGVSVCPNSVLDVVAKVVGSKAVIIGIEYTEGATETVKVAVTRSGWTAADMQTDLRALGDSVAYNTYTSGADDTIVSTTGTFAAVEVAAGATFVGTAS